MNKNTISVVISAFNEEKKIATCLESVKWADEIIFVDNSSTDKTAEIAKKFTKNIFKQKNDPSNIDMQKNFGIQKATGDWILVLDADEIVTTELAEEIRTFVSGIKSHPGPLLKGEGDVSGYLIPRKNIIFGKWIQHSGWYPDHQLRLFKQGEGKFEKKHVHEPLVIKGEVGKLTEHIIHNNYESVSQFLHRGLLVYAPNEAEELLRKGYVFDYKDVIRFPLKEFLSRYFAREGYKDGFHGLVLSFLMAFYHFAVFVYLWEKKNFVEVKREELVKGMRDEFNNAAQEISYWISSKKIEQETSTLKKVGLKIKRKLNL